MAHQTYYPFGGVRTSEGTSPTDFAFTGQRSDASSALMYYGARYYDPVLGRFAHADTLVPSGGYVQKYDPCSLRLRG